MPKADNPILGTIDCDRCGGESSVLRTKRGNGSDLYTRCTECKADQRTGKHVNAYLLNNAQFREGVNLEGLNLPVDFAVASSTDYVPGEVEEPTADAEESAVVEPEEELVEPVGEEPGKPSKFGLVGCLLVVSSVLGGLWASTQVGGNK